MDPESVSFMIGRMIPVLICIGIVGMVASRASKIELRSLRLARYAIACGLLILPLICLLTFARGREGRILFFAGGSLMILAGISAILLAIKARGARKAEGGPGRIAVPVAILLGLLSVAFGSSTIALPTLANPRNGTSNDVAWTHRVDPPGFEITLPSANWRKSDTTRDIALFGCRMPQMLAVVKEVRPSSTAAEFEKAVNDMKRLVGKNNVRIIEEKREPNANGHEHWRFLGEEQSPQGRVLVAVSATWWNKEHAVIVLFEGQHQMASQAAQDQESQGYQTAARSILSSIK